LVIHYLITIDQEVYDEKKKLLEYPDILLAVIRDKRLCI